MSRPDQYALLSAIRMGDEIAENMRQQSVGALDALKADLLCSVRWQYAHNRVRDIHQWLLLGSQWKEMADNLRRLAPSPNGETPNV